jgi:hypothetical protein
MANLAGRRPLDAPNEAPAALSITVSSARRRTPMERDGYCEFYNPLTGDGLAAKRFGMSTLLVDLMRD